MQWLTVAYLAKSNTLKGEKTKKKSQSESTRGHFADYSHLLPFTEQWVIAMIKLLNSKKWTLINDLESPLALCISTQLTTVTCPCCLGSWFSYLSIFTLVHPSSWSSAWVTSSTKPSQTNQVHTLDLSSPGSRSRIFQCAIKGFPSVYWHCIPVYHTLQTTCMSFCSWVSVWRVCTHTPHLCGHMCVGEHALVYGGQKLVSRVFPIYSPFYLLRQIPSLKPELDDSASLASQLVPGIPSPHPTMSS